MGDHEAAIAEFEKALKLGSADKNQGESEDNVRLLTENLVIAHQKRGLAFFEKKSYFKAEQAFKEGLELAPDNVNLHLSLAQVYLVLERWDNAAKYVDKALKLDPNNVPGRKMMVNLNMRQGYNYFQTKDYERSLEYFSKIPADLMPQDEASQKNMVIIEKQFGQVFSNNRTSWRTKDRLVRLRLSLAVLHMNRDELIKAKAVLKSAVDLKPQDKDVRSLLIEGCEKLREMFTKRGAGGETREIVNWEKMLKSY
jgi:tetratricopeptide (TPR) repeat protein